MVFSGVGFDNNIAEALKRNRNSKDTQKEIRSMLRNYVTQFRRHYQGDKREASVAGVDESFTFGRRIVIEPNNPVEPEVLLALKQLQESDEELGQILLSQPEYVNGETGEFNKYTAMYRCAVRILIEEETDVLVQQLGCAPPTTSFRQEAVRLFEQFFQVCQRPNAAEIALLARVGITDTAQVQEWFNQKRERMKPVFIAGAIGGGNGPVAKYLRKERLGLNYRVTKKKPLTRH